MMGLVVEIGGLQARKATVLAIHDEIVIEAPADQAEAAKEWLVKCMTDGMSDILRDVPVVVEAVVQETWG